MIIFNFVLLAIINWINALFSEQCNKYCVTAFAQESKVWF